MMYNNITRRTKSSSLREQIELRNIEIELIKQLKIVSKYFNKIKPFYNTKKNYIRKSKKEYHKFTPDIKLIKIQKLNYINTRKMIRIHKRSRPISYYPPGFPPTPVGFRGFPCEYYEKLYHIE